MRSCVIIILQKNKHNQGGNKMYLIGRQENVKPDLEMMERIIDELNTKFDPHDLYHHSDNESEMFEFQMKIDDKRREAWQIVFMGHYTVVSGSFFGYDYSDCQEEEYITLEAKNELKIKMLATNGAINVISKFIEYVANSDASDKNKREWIEALERGLEEE